MKEEYERLSKALIEEHEKVFAAQDLDELEAFLDTLGAADRIFVIGVGREGLAMRALAMRLMHLGKEVHWIWDDTTPGLGPGDLLLACSGSGEIGHIDYVVEQAKERGAQVAVITGSPAGRTPKRADRVLFVPAFVYKGTDPRVVPSVQPMGSLYEQHLLLLADMMVLLLQERSGVSAEEMEKRHRNVE